MCDQPQPSWSRQTGRPAGAGFSSQDTVQSSAVLVGLQKKKLRGGGLQLTCIMCRAELALVFSADSRQDHYPRLSLDMGDHNLKHSQHLAAKMHPQMCSWLSCPMRRMSGHNGFMSSTEHCLECVPFH